MKTAWKTSCAFGMALCLLAVTQVIGQVRQSGDQDNPLARKDASHQKVCLASKVKGMLVKDSENQQCGQIQDLVIDATGQVQYLAIAAQDQSAGGNAIDSEQSRLKPAPKTAGQKPAQTDANQNAKLTLVPFEAVEFHEGEIASQNYASLKTIDKDRLAQAPSFTRMQLTSQTQQNQWMSQVDQFFDRQKSGAARPDLNNKDREEKKRDRNE